MISALETVIKYLLGDADLDELVDGRIASKHQYGSGWELNPPDRAVQVQYDGGAAELYVEWQRPRLEVRCYGPSQYECDRVYRRLVEISRATLRESAEVTDGTALLYWLNTTSAPSFFRDPDIDVDMILVFMEAAVAEEAVG